MSRLAAQWRRGAGLGPVTIAPNPSPSAASKPAPPAFSQPQSPRRGDGARQGTLQIARDQMYLRGQA